MKVAIVEGFISEKVKEASHTTNLGEAHGADIVVVVRRTRRIAECMRIETPTNAIAGFNYLVRDAEVVKNESGIQARST